MLERMLARRHVAALDLTVIRMKVRERLGWSFEKTDEVELAYRRFLYALARNRTGFSISPPTAEVDEFWHEHILNTRKYREDCDRIFGRYMDHTPGLSSEEQFRADARRRQVYEDDSIDYVYFDGRDYGSGGDGGDACADWTSSTTFASGDDSHHAHSHSGVEPVPAGEGLEAAGQDSGSSDADSSGGDSSGGDSDSGGGDSGGGDGGGGDGGGGCGGSSCGGGGGE